MVAQICDSNQLGIENKLKNSICFLPGRPPRIWPSIASPAQAHAAAAPAREHAVPAFPACPATTRRPYTGGEGRCSDQRSAQEPTRHALHPTLLSLVALSPCLSISRSGAVAVCHRTSTLPHRRWLVRPLKLAVDRSISP